jgi:hypothetical protein
MGLSVATILLISLYTTINRGECRVHPPFSRPLYDTQAVFVAKIVYVPVAWNPSKNYEPWTIGLLQHRYWGLPWWTPRLVVLGHSAPYLRKGGEYFIDLIGMEAAYPRFFHTWNFAAALEPSP